MTPEEMAAQIIELQENQAALTLENETLKTNEKSFNSRITELQEHNQKLFLKITQPETKKKEEEEVLSTVDFAKTLKGVIK